MATSSTIDRKFRSWCGVGVLWFAAACTSDIEDPPPIQSGSGGSFAALPPVGGTTSALGGCPVGLLPCAAACVSVANDPKNCGACGRSCPYDQMCDQGTCKAMVPSCSAGLVDCAGSCVDTQTSSAHCGQCNSACPATEVCAAGSCACPSGKLRCGASCVDTTADSAHCGACNNACSGGRTCQASSCACPAGQSLCGDACVDTQTNAQHCGACGTACSNGRTCEKGVCACGAGKVSCGDTCADTQTDDRNCGGCGKVCSLGQACSAGTCGGGGTLREDGCAGLAQNLTISQIAVYQTVKIAIMRNGSEVAPAMRNTDVIIGKDALFRVFITAGAGFTSRELSARVFVQKADAVQTFYAKATLSGSTQEGDLATSFQIKVPKGALSVDSRYAVEIVECGEPVAGTATTARFPATDGAALGARDTGVVKIRIIPMQIDSMVPDTSEAGLKVYKDRFMALYPISDVQFTVAPPMTFQSATQWTQNLDRMRQQRQADKPAADVYYYGLLKSANSFREFCGGGCTAGIGYVPTGNSANWAAQRVALGIGFADATSADTMTHEVAHNHGREHAPCGQGIAGVDPDFPYMGGQIGVYGYDAQTEKLIPPERTDLMGYCNNKWLSDYTYDAILNRVAMVNGMQNASTYVPPELVRPWNVLILDNGIATWGAPIETPEPPAGEPEPAEILDDLGRVIAIETVYRTEISDIAAASFEVPRPLPGWHAVRVLGGYELEY